MAFYLPQSERNQMEMNVAHAVEKAIKFLDEAKVSSDTENEAENETSE